jgi:hypothetical protein
MVLPMRSASFFAMMKQEIGNLRIWLLKRKPFLAAAHAQAKPFNHGLLTRPGNANGHRAFEATSRRP